MTDAPPAGLLGVRSSGARGDRNSVHGGRVVREHGHGEPRSTRTWISSSIRPSSSFERLVSELDPENYYFDPDVARDALRRRAMFNVIEIGDRLEARSRDPAERDRFRSRSCSDARS